MKIVFFLVLFLPSIAFSQGVEDIIETSAIDSVQQNRTFIFEQNGWLLVFHKNGIDEYQYKKISKRKRKLNNGDLLIVGKKTLIWKTKTTCVVYKKGVHLDTI